MAFDPQCSQLAAYFLDADESYTKERESELAQAIQDAVEAYLNAR